MFNLGNLPLAVRAEHVVILPARASHVTVGTYTRGPIFFLYRQTPLLWVLQSFRVNLASRSIFFCFLFFGSLANRIGVRWSTSLVRDWLRRWKTRVRKRRRWSRRSTTRRSLSNRFISEPNSTHLLRFMIFSYVAPIAIHWKFFPFLYLNKGSSFINRRLVPTKKRKIFVIVFRPLLHSQFIESWCFFLFTLFGLWNFVFEYINREKKKEVLLLCFCFWMKNFWYPLEYKSNSSDTPQVSKFNFFPLPKFQWINKSIDFLYHLVCQFIRLITS